ncbi:MAG: RNA polymerase sporulation sigma factor SigK [Clostridioides sp.]|nr:RNA polymerase sporulation sigma factor SigK [Clostridioides sp.]
MTLSKSFLQPLNPEEESFYLSKYKNENNKEAKDILIERNMRLVAFIAKKYLNFNEEQDDLISVGTIGLIKAIETYSSDKGTKLATYSSRCIENEILMYIRSNKKNRYQVSLQDPIGKDPDGNEINLFDVLGTDSNYVSDKVELNDNLSKLYANINTILSKRERKIIELRYGLTVAGYKTQKEIADQLKISRSYVSRIEKKALNKLKKEINSNNY